MSGHISGDTNIARKKKISIAPASETLDVINTSLDDDKAQDVVVIDLHGKTGIADYMVIASGTSSRMVATMARHIQEKLKPLGIIGVSPEGVGQNDWVLIDGGDVIVHIFRPEVREFYDLEKIWGDSQPQPHRVA